MLWDILNLIINSRQNNLYENRYPVIHITFYFIFFHPRNLFGPKDYTDDYKLGLKLATKEQLRAIPMASTPFSGESLPTIVDLFAKSATDR
ncbi:MAG: hypothetical protein WDO19_28230 [Bacteroidota bacterium]